MGKTTADPEARATRALDLPEDAARARPSDEDRHPGGRVGGLSKAGAVRRRSTWTLQHQKVCKLQKGSKSSIWGHRSPEMAGQSADIKRILVPTQATEKERLGKEGVSLKDPRAPLRPDTAQPTREGCWEGPPRPRSHVAVILEASAEQAPCRSPAARPRVLRTGPRPAGVWGLCRPWRHGLRVTWWRPQSLRPVSLRGATRSVLSAGRPAFLRPPAWRWGRPRVRVREALSSQAPSAVFLS